MPLVPGGLGLTSMALGLGAHGWLTKSCPSVPSNGKNCLPLWQQLTPGVTGWPDAASGSTVITRQSCMRGMGNPRGTPQSWVYYGSSSMWQRVTILPSNWCTYRASIILWSLATVVDRSINRRRNRRPAGTTLAANDSLLMKDSSSRFEALRRLSQDCTSSRISASFSCGRESVRASESKRIPRNVIWVDGPSSLSKAMGTPKCSQADRVAQTEAAHWSRPAAPTMRKSSR